MTPAALLSDLTSRGVEFVACGHKLRFRPVDRVTQDEVVLIRQHKAVILKLLRADGREAAPIIEGTEHFSLWVDDAEGPWPEFVPGLHHDLRQPSRLRGLLVPKQTFESIVPQTIAQDAPGIAPTGRVDV